MLTGLSIVASLYRKDAMRYTFCAFRSRNHTSNICKVDSMGPGAYVL